MKKQNGINKLAFNKVGVAELNFNEMNDVNGGTTPFCIYTAVEVFVLGVEIGGLIYMAANH